MENRDMKDKMNFELLLIPCYSETLNSMLL